MSSMKGAMRALTPARSYAARASSRWRLPVWCQMRGRAEAAAQHEQIDRTAAGGKPLRRRGEFGDLTTHGIAGVQNIFAFERTRKGRAHALRERRQQAVRHARDGILFVDHERFVLLFGFVA